jgi:eukaryotic-like serine/threonine-protein kinase
MTKLVEDLERWLEHRPIRARPAGRVERVAKWARRDPLPAALLVLLVLSLVGGSAGSTYCGVAAGRRADETQKALEHEAEARKAAVQATADERWE